MRILKIWGNGSEKRRNIDINIEDWTDFAPDLSEYFSNESGYAKTEDLNIKATAQEKQSKPDKPAAQDFEIDWNIVRQREDWIAPVANTAATKKPEVARAQMPARSTQAYANDAAQAARKAEVQKAQAARTAENSERTQRAEYFDEQDDEAIISLQQSQAKSRKKGKKKAKKASKTSNKSTKNGTDEQKKRHPIRTFAVFVIVFAGLYATAVFSNIPFIEKWRTIYIETAMSTMNHQWLATAFLPPSVINKVVGEREALESEQDGITSNWDDIGSNFEKSETKTSAWEKLEGDFYETYSEIDKKSFDEYMKKNEKDAINENGFLMIDKAGLNDADTGIITKGDDRVVAIDTENGITIAEVKGEGYVGKLAIIKDPSRVGVALAAGYGSAGSFATDIAKKRNAVLAINASGFFDPEGKGNGGVAHGIVISKSKKYNDVIDGTYKTIALDEKDRLNIGHYKSTSGFRDAVEFKPALIVDGKTLVSGSAGWGVQPRTAIGQTKDGTILMLVIDGRAPGYSIGATVGECAKILKRYGAVQACNLDGGSSSIMDYRGREITKPSAANKEKGRHIPNAFVVYEA